jgi:hypothetical protein
VLAYALSRWPGVDARLHASGAQTAFRFNSFIALALSERLVQQHAASCIAHAEASTGAALPRFIKTSSTPCWSAASWRTAS